MAQQAGLGPGQIQPPAGTPFVAGPALPDWIVFGGGLLMVAGIAEGLHAINPRAGYMFAFLVLMGYAVTGHRLEEGVKFGKSIGLIAR